MITLLLVGRGRVGMPIDEQRAYMREAHGAAVVRLIADDPDVAPRRYVQNHVMVSFPAGSGLDKDFVTQVWFDDREQMRAALTTPRYLEELQPDEDNFVDQSSVIPLPVERTVLVEPGADASAKVFLLLPSEPRAGSDGAMRTRSLRGLVRNDVTRPDAPYAVVYEAWFDDVAAATVAASAWQSADPVDGNGPRLALVATEYVLHAGSISALP